MFPPLKQLKYYSSLLIKLDANNNFLAKLGIVLIFIVLSVPDKEIAAIALFFESKIGAPTPYT